MKGEAVYATAPDRAVDEQRLALGSRRVHAEEGRRSSEGRGRVWLAGGRGLGQGLGCYIME